MNDGPIRWDWRRWGWLLPLCLFILSFYVRTRGLSHDLDFGYEYHTDTLKQMLATQKFLDGHYYYEIGHPDYDGYPYFNSHLLEYLCRAYDAVRLVTLQHLGIRPPASSVHRSIDLVWLARLLNGVLSALAAVVVFHAGRVFFGWRVGVCAGLFLALSPVDVSIAHYATSDSTAGFFAIGAVFFALHVARGNSLWAYVLGGLSVAAAFSTKYHGGMVAISMLLAHFFHFLPARRWWSRAALSRLALLALAGAVGVLATSPALLVNWRSASSGILEFLRYTSDFGFSDELRAMSPFQRIGYSMGRNLPTFVNLLGPILCGAALAALFLRKSRKAIWVTAVFPLVFLLVGLTTKPKSPPVYLSLVTPALFLLAAVALCRLIAWTKRPRLGFTLFVLLALPSVVYLGDYTRKELFFFQNTDTRKLAESWAVDNIPRTFDIARGRYSIEAEGRDVVPAPAGTVFVESGEHTRQPSNTFLLHSIVLEDRSSQVFTLFRRGNLTDYCRNREVFFFADEGEFIRPGHTLPVFQPVPDEKTDTVIPANAPWFYRTRKALHVQAGERAARVIASAGPLDGCILLVKSGPRPSFYRIRIGGRRFEGALAGGESRTIPLVGIRPIMPVSRHTSFYRMRARALCGDLTVLFLTSALEKGFAFYNVGDYEGAFQSFGSIPASRRNVSAEALRRISGLATGLLTDDDLAGLPPCPPALAGSDLIEHYGVSGFFLDGLPYLTFSHVELDACGFRSAPDAMSVCDSSLQAHAGDGTNWVATPLVSLEPGSYRATAYVRGAAVACHGFVNDARGRHLVATGALAMPGNLSGFEPVSWPFEIMRDAGTLAVRFVFRDSVGLSVDRVEIRPDPLATVNARLQVLSALRTGQLGGLAGLSAAWHPLLSVGDQCRERGDMAGAVRLYLAAAAACPFRARAGERLYQMREQWPEPLKDAVAAVVAPYLRARGAGKGYRPVNAVFKKGARLVGYRLGSNVVAPGEILDLDFYWSPDSHCERVDAFSVWARFRSRETGEAYSWGDRSLLTALLTSPADDFMMPCPDRIRIGMDAKPGEYCIRVGLRQSEEKKKVGLRSADLSHDRKGVVVTNIIVRPLSQ